MIPECIRRLSIQKLKKLAVLLGVDVRGCKGKDALLAALEPCFFLEVTEASDDFEPINFQVLLAQIKGDLEALAARPLVEELRITIENHSEHQAQRKPTSAQRASWRRRIRDLDLRYDDVVNIAVANQAVHFQTDYDHAARMIHALKKVEADRRREGN